MHSSRKWVHLQEWDTKEPFYKNGLFLDSFSLIRPFLRVFVGTNTEKDEDQSNKNN